MKNLFRKELNYYLNNPVGYIIIILFSLFANFLFIKDIFISGSASMKPFFGILPWLFLIFVPALTMRILSEENRTNTLEVLLTLPVSEFKIVMAKFFSLIVLIVFGLGLTMGLPISLSFLTKMSFMEVAVGYLGELLLASFFISVSLVFSSITKNQVVAFLTSSICLFFLLVLGTDFLSGLLPKIVLDNITIFSPIYHLQNFAKGVIDLRSVFYFFGSTLILLFMTIVNLEKRD